MTNFRGPNHEETTALSKLAIQAGHKGGEIFFAGVSRLHGDLCNGLGLQPRNRRLSNDLAARKAGGAIAGAGVLPRHRGRHHRIPTELTAIAAGHLDCCLAETLDLVFITQSPTH